MLEPVRQYASEQLRAHIDEERQARSRQLEYLADLAETAEESILGGSDQPWLRRLDDELDNIRVALAWGFDNELEAASRLATALWWFCEVRALYMEGRSGRGGPRNRADGYAPERCT